MTIANGRIWRGEIRNRAKDGSLYWVDTTIVPFVDDRRKPYQYMAIRYEITARKRSEELLREQAALARLGEMAAVVAHEVRNPIAGIRGALQIISNRMGESRDRAVIGEIVARLDALNGIVQDLLVFARPRELKIESVALKPLIATTAELIRRDPELAGIQINVSGDGVVVQADPQQLQIVFQNVMLNALRRWLGVEISMLAWLRTAIHARSHSRITDREFRRTSARKRSMRSSRRSTEHGPWLADRAPCCRSPRRKHPHRRWLFWWDGCLRVSTVALWSTLAARAARAHQRQRFEKKSRQREKFLTLFDLRRATFSCLDSDFRMAPALLRPFPEARHDHRETHSGAD